MTSLRHLHEALPEEKQKELIAKCNSQIAENKTDRAFNDFPQNALLDDESFKALYKELETFFVSHEVSSESYEFDEKGKGKFIEMYYDKFHKVAMDMLLDGRGNLKADLIKRFGWEDKTEVFNLKFIRDLIASYVEALFENFIERLFGDRERQSKEQKLLEQSACSKMKIDDRWCFRVTYYNTAMGRAHGEHNKYEKRFNNISPYRLTIESILITQNTLLEAFQTEKNPTKKNALIKNYILIGMMQEIEREAADAKEEHAALQAIVTKASEASDWLPVLMGEQDRIAQLANHPKTNMILQKFIAMAEYYFTHELANELAQLPDELAKLPRDQVLQRMLARGEERDPSTLKFDLSTASTSDDDSAFSPYSVSSVSPTSQKSPVSLNKAPAPFESKSAKVAKVAHQLMRWLQPKAKPPVPPVLRPLSESSILNTKPPVVRRQHSALDAVISALRR